MSNDKASAFGIEADTSDAAVKERIQKNQRVARECMALIMKRNRKLEAEVVFEQVVNTIGVMAAEMIRDARGIGIEGLPEVVTEIIGSHIDNALAQVQQPQKFDS